MNLKKSCKKNKVFLRLKKLNFNGDIYNVGSGTNYSVNEIADMFGGEKQYGNQVIEPFETLAETAKIDLDLNF